MSLPHNEGMNTSMPSFPADVDPVALLNGLSAEALSLRLHTVEREARLLRLLLRTVRREERASSYTAHSMPTGDKEGSS
jgi:hypothetical protein